MLKEKEMHKDGYSSIDNNTELNFHIIVSSSFTCDLISDPVNFLLKKIGMPGKCVIGPYNQVFQQLINPLGLFFTNKSGANVILIQIEDWYRYISKTVESELINEIVEKNTNEFIALLKDAAEKTSIPFVVCICPSNPKENVKFINIINKAGDTIEKSLESVNNVYLIKQKEIGKNFHISDFFNDYTNKISHIPYTESYFTVLAYTIMRKIYTLFFPPYKAIIVDCDNTLWKGICGEDNVNDLVINDNHKFLQNFLIQKSNEGMLICLNSKNNKDDVINVFSSHSDMALKMEHIVSWRCNWEPKSKNITEIAKELNIGQDSLIFIDDDPVECTEVEMNCPEILTIRFPEDGKDIQRILNGVWAFDHLKVTDEDRKRTEFYKQKIQRDVFQNNFSDYRKFLSELDLKVSIVKASSGNFARIAQLSRRTNQFNFTSKRYNETEIESLCIKQNYECLCFNVKDRFGDYGMVGMVLLQKEPDILTVDTFLLSCRAMGRGVENIMISHIADITLKNKINVIRIPFRLSGKNEPACNYLEKIAGKYKKGDNGSYIYHLPVEAGLELKEQIVNADPVPEKNDVNKKATIDKKFLVSLEKDYEDVEKLTGQIRLSCRKKIIKQTKQAAPRTPLEADLIKIWSDLLGIEGIGIDDDFFSLGGYSILLIQILSRVKDKFDIEIPMESAFSGYFTVSKLAKDIYYQKIKQMPINKIKSSLEKINSLSDNEVIDLLRTNENKRTN